MTVCQRCLFYMYVKKYNRDGSSYAEDLCAAEAVQIASAVDFVTGRMNEPAEKRPLCRTINTDGNCPHYQARSE
jgi:hypothetical protein